MDPGEVCKESKITTSRWALDFLAGWSLCGGCVITMQDEVQIRCCQRKATGIDWRPPKS